MVSRAEMVTRYRLIRDKKKRRKRKQEARAIRTALSTIAADMSKSNIAIIHPLPRPLIILRKLRFTGKSRKRQQLTFSRFFFRDTEKKFLPHCRCACGN